MYLLLCLALIGAAFGVPVNEELTRNEDLAARYVLPAESRPTFYDVQLFLNPDNADFFSGNVSIRIVANVATNQLVLHALAVEIESITVVSDNSPQNIYLNYTLATDDTELLRIQLINTINPDVPHTVTITYRGQYAPSMFGIYVSSYTFGTTQRNLITSQLQPTYARRAFPCYDEPRFKAIFRTTIYAPAAYPVVRTNMPLRTDLLKPNVPGLVKHEFQDTNIMSSYLLAYLVSDFDHISNENNPVYNVPFKVFSRPGTQNTAVYALDFGQKNMIQLEEYTEMKYSFPKIDKAAVPDFAAGAMENWGLVIYREVALLVQDGVTTTNIRQNIARIISHENTHMWFGNEVSPVSWTYTWLNEGFANLYENFGVDLVQPHYRMMDQYVLILQNVMQSDAVLSINPMTYPVFTPSQIIGQFNAVAYQKSGSVLRMLQHIMTPEIFRRSLVIYLRENAGKAVVPADLYASLQTGLQQNNYTLPWSVSTIMTRWTEQGGFPVLTVRRTAPNADSIFVSQERFLTDRTLTSNDRWHVPINWVLSTDVSFSDTSPQGWVPPSFPATSFNIPGLSQAQWFIVNKQQTGYYRVNYEPQNWRALSQLLNTSHETIHVLNRAQIVDDSFNLARNGRLDYSYPFEISRYLVKEKDYIPWGSANAALNYLDVVLSGTDVYNLFQYYMLNLTAPLYGELGFDVGSNEEHVTPYHRNIILDVNCRYGNEACVNKAQELLESYRNNPAQSINPDIQNLVFCSGLRGGSVENFRFLWDEYRAATDPSRQSILLNSLGCTSNDELLDEYLNQVIVNASEVREQDRHSILVSAINASPKNMERALSFVHENFHLIQPRVQGLTGTTNILNAFSRRLTTKEHNTIIDQFVERHGSILTAGEVASVAAIRENIAASITWTNENLATVDAWLRENYGAPSNATALTSSIIVLISICLTFFNQ